MARRIGPLVHVERIDRDESADLLTRWQHPLGPCRRPYRVDHWALHVAGDPVAVAVSASIVSPTIRDETGRTWPRTQVVELARIATHPANRWATRPMLRLWRDVLALTWPDPRQLVSYALPGTPGNIYRFDGWTRVRRCRPARPGPGSGWSKASATDTLGDGAKTLWRYSHWEAT